MSSESRKDDFLNPWRDADLPKGRPELPDLGDRDDFPPGLAPWANLMRMWGVRVEFAMAAGTGTWPTMIIGQESQNAYLALWVAKSYWLPVKELMRVWSFWEGELVGPSWHMTFSREANPDGK